tara:strand:- start:38 stop:511 length:474 start_codon:yes stop_codon:yes gene_type:complete
MVQGMILPTMPSLGSQGSQGCPFDHLYDHLISQGYGEFEGGLLNEDYFEQNKQFSRQFHVGEDSAGIRYIAFKVHRHSLRGREEENGEFRFFIYDNNLERDWQVIRCDSRSYFPTGDLMIFWSPRYQETDGFRNLMSVIRGNPVNDSANWYEYSIVY